MENREVADKRPHRALMLIQAQPGLFLRQGAVVATWRNTGTRRIGPYYRLDYHEGRRLRSIYLGRDGPLVEAVRRALAAVQAPWQSQRLDRRLRRRTLASLRCHKGLLDRRLRALGLHLKGFEVRGWRVGLGLPKIG